MDILYKSSRYSHRSGKSHFVSALRFWIVLAVVAFSTCSSFAASKPFKVITKKEGNTTRFFVENFEAAEITATFDMNLENLTGSANFPYTATFPPNKVTEAFTVRPSRTDAEWNYSYTTHYTMGSSVAVHDNSYIYALPFESGSAFRVSQGYNGSYSHTGPDQYAVDFRMPVGTPIHAARGGKVVKTKVDSSAGGADRKHQNNANYILIRHADGTLANYAHLKKDGTAVKVGQTVEAGDLIGYSGNTGFSSGPHLHFSVFKTRNGSQRQTLPVKFKTMDSLALTLVEGKSYTCATHGHPPSRKAVAATTVADTRPISAVGRP